MEQKKKSILDNKFFPIAIVLAAAGIILLIAPSLFGNKTKDTKTAELLAKAAREADAEFIKKLETGIGDIVKGVSGYEAKSIMITLDEGTQYVYFYEEGKSSNTSSSSSSSESNVKLVTLSNGEGGEEPVLVREILPKILGAVIVCNGINSADVEYKITEAVKTALGLPSNKIFVTFSK